MLQEDFAIIDPERRSCLPNPRRRARATRAGSFTWLLYVGSFDMSLII